MTSPTEQESRSLHWSLISGDWGAPERLTAGPSSKQQRRLLTAYTPATGRPAKLTIKQQEQVFRWINGRDPRQYGLDFGLWTRQIAATLIEQKFGVKLGVTAVGRLLARWGMSPQKPLQQIGRAHV